MKKLKMIKRAVALMLCAVCLSVPLMGMAAFADSGKDPSDCPYCDCTVRCTTEAGNSDCPMCARDISGCIGKPTTPAPVCDCTTKCGAGAVKVDCAVCQKDLAGCIGKEPEPVPVCGCTAKCKDGAVNTACPICKTDLTGCKGKEAAPPITAGSYAVTIAAPSGWYTKAANVEIRIEDLNGTGWKKVEVRIERNGSWIDLSDDLADTSRTKVEITENCTLYVSVTDKEGKATTKSRYIECFDRTAPTVKTGIDGKLLRVEASDELSGVEAIYIDGERYTGLTNGTLDVRLRDLEDEYDQLSIQAVDYAGNKSKVVLVKNPNYKAPSANKGEDKPTATTPTPAPTPEATTKPTATPQPTTPPNTTANPGTAVKPSTGTQTGGTSTTGGTNTGTASGSKTENTAEPEETRGPNPFTPDGAATVVDNATGEDGKEFYTIQTPNENVFYLVIDKQRTAENVYFLNAVTEQDLMALATTDAQPETTEPEQTPAPAPEPEPETPTPEPEQKPDGGNFGTILLVLAVVGIGGGAGWYFKIYRPKHGIPELDEDESEYEDEDGELPPWDMDEPEMDKETEDEE